MGSGSLARSVDSPWVAEGLDSRLLAISPIEERD